MRDLTVVMPCFREDPEVVTKTYNEIQSLGCKVIIVNDGNTVEIPETYNTVNYVPNMGYGYALKRGIEKADTDLVLTCDSDGQHQAEDVWKLYHTYKMIKDCKMVVGQRWNIDDKPHRWVGRKLLNFLGSVISGHYLSDMNSGMRIFDRKMALGYKDVLCDTFSFTTSLTMAVVTDNHKMTYFPIEVLPRPKGKSHVKLVRDGLITLWYIVWVGGALRTRKLRGWLRKLIS